MSKGANTLLHDVTWMMPRLLNEAGLADSISVEIGRNEQPMDVRIGDIILPLDKGSGGGSARVVMDWRNTVWFDDAALAETILIQRRLLAAGIVLLHAPVSISQDKPFFVDGLFRQLLAVGYFRTWATPEFGASEEEVARLTALNPVTSLGPLSTADEILGFQACHSEDQSDMDAKEESQIRSYEDAMSRLLFREGAVEQLRECPLVASGKFGQFVVRQVRGNVGEHANATLGLSMVRLVHSATEHDSWGMTEDECPRLIADGELGALKAGNNSSNDDVYMCMTTIDDGLGIHKHLRTRWDREYLGTEPAARRVLACLKACPDYDAIGEEARPFIQTLEFAMDKDGTSKEKKERSPETPGLHRLDKLTKDECGIVEITSGKWCIRHAAGKLSINASKRAMPVGTLIRVWLPLRRGDLAMPQHRRPPRSHISHMVGSRGASDPLDIVFLSDEWDQANIPLGPTGIQQFADMVRGQVKALIRAEGQSTNIRPTAIFLDWSELQWREHESSLFLHAIRRWYRTDESLNVPIIPVNIPERMLLLAKDALAAFAKVADAEDPKWQGPLPFYLCTDQGNTCWYGIPAKDGLDANTAQAVDRMLNIALGEPTAYQDPKSGHLSRKQIEGQVEECKRQCPLFTEATTRDTSTGQQVPSGRFLPVVSYEKIQERIGATFTGKLHKRLLARCMRQRKPAKPSKGQEWAYIQLPNGKLADRYFRCDLLLSSPGIAQGNATSDMSGRLGFDRSLSTHLVELAKAMEERLGRRFDLVVSCTSPNHWFVHHIADGLTDKTHNCGHFVARSRSSFNSEFMEFTERRQVRDGSLVLIFTDVISNCGTVKTMCKALVDEKLEIGGLIALLDTRDEERMGKTADEKSLGIRGLPDDRTVILAREKVKIQNTPAPEWRVDPESLELVPVRSESNWPSVLSGVGELAVSGPDVRNWFETFAVLRHKHYKHGPRHSEYVCDVKLLLSAPEIRLFMAARLAWYAHKHKIKLIVYPCHSNAYLLAELLRTGWQDDSGVPSLQVALCRTRADERSYVLPEGEKLEPPEQVMILDDAVGGGASFKSLASEIYRQYGTHVKAMHLVVFCNEFPLHQRIFWSRMAASEKESPSEKKASRKKKAPIKPLLFGKMHFTSFISLPAASYPERLCPICARREEFRERCDDKNLTVYEHLFYDEWQNALTVRDLSHHPREHSTPDSHDQANGPEDDSQNALKMLAFDESLRGDVRIADLVNAACEEKVVEVKIHCLRMLREHELTCLDSSLLGKTNENLLSLLYRPDFKLKREQARLVVKALMRQKKLVTAEDFISLVSVSYLWFADPYFLGAVFAYARMGAPDQHACPPWHSYENVTKCLQDGLEHARFLENAQEEELSKNWGINSGIKKMARDFGDEKSKKLALVREGLTLLRCWFQRGGEAKSDGDFACVLWDACRDTYGHTTLPTETDQLAQEIDQLKNNPKADMGSRQRVAERSRTVCRLLRKILDAVSIAVERNNPICMRDKINHAESRLIDFDEATRQITDAVDLPLQQALTTAYQCIDYFKCEWTGIGGNLSKLLQQYKTPLDACIQNALCSVNVEIANRSNKASLSLIPTEDDLDVVVFAPPDLLQKAFHNAFASIWKYQVRHEYDSAEGATLKVDVRVERCRKSDPAHGSQILIRLWCEAVPWQEMPCDLFPVGHGNHEVRALMTEYRGEYHAYCDESKQCVVTCMTLIDATTHGKSGLTNSPEETPNETDAYHGN